MCKPKLCTGHLIYIHKTTRWTMITTWSLDFRMLFMATSFSSFGFCNPLRWTQSSKHMKIMLCVLWVLDFVSKPQIGIYFWKFEIRVPLVPGFFRGKNNMLELNDLRFQLFQNLQRTKGFWMVCFLFIYCQNGCYMSEPVLWLVRIAIMRLKTYIRNVLH
jgi:hypothetical protein